MKRLLFTLVLIFIGITLSAMGVKEYRYNIVSVGSHDQLQGKRFFIGGGYLKDIRCYFTYVEFSDGGLKLLTLAADSTTIYESDIKSFVQLRIRHGDFWAEEYNFRYAVEWHSEAELHVPRGTVIKEFKIEP